jgi:hypothetical protein
MVWKRIPSCSGARGSSAAPSSAAGAAPGTGASLAGRSQARHRGVLEELPRRDPHSRRRRARHHLQLRMESPPRWKKLSWIPTRSTRSTSRHTEASTSSAWVRGGTNSSRAAPYSGSGSAPRSSFPLGVSGSRSSCTRAAGTMYAGRRDARWARSSATSSAAPSCATT